MAESKYWVFTYNANDNVEGNYTEAWPKDIEEHKTGKGATVKVTCSLGQEERGDSGNYHLQGYVEFEKKIKLSTLKNNFSSRIHWEIRKGSAEDAWHYCWKDMDCEKYPIKANEMRYPETRWMNGTISKVSKGSRTDLESVKEMVLSGKKRKDIATEHFGTFAKYSRGIEAAATAMGYSLEDELPKWVERECHVFYGPSGTGKSLAADQKMDGKTFYVPEQNAQGQLSFETYNGEHWIFLDDFEPATLRPGVLKRMMDGRPMNLPGRGSNSARPGRHLGVIITTNWNPETWVEGAMQDVEWTALSRRCKTVWNCGAKNWTIVGGTQFQVGEKVDSPLPGLLEWAQARSGAGQQEPIDLSQD